MTLEELKELGLDDDMAKKVADASAEELKGFIPKSRFNEVNTEKKSLETELKTANDTLDELKKNNKDNEALQKTIQEKDEAIKSLQNDHKAEMAQMRIDSAVETGLLKAKAKNIKAAKALLDLEGIKVSEDGTIKDLEDRIKKVSESDPYLFGDGKPTGAPPKDPQGSTNSSEESIGARIAKQQNEKSKPTVDPWANE